MLFRLHIALLVIFAAMFFGARMGANHAGVTSHYGATHCATESSIVSLELTDLTLGCLPDTVKRWVPVAIFFALGIFPILPIFAPRPIFFRSGFFHDVRLVILNWGVAAGVIAQPPDLHNRKEPGFIAIPA